MNKKLPPLNALRAFEATARNLSITKAARELCVTHAAISQQVKLLEDYLCISLFHRDGKHITLSNQGKIYSAALSTAFSTMKQATENLFNQTDPNMITIRIPLTFALCWFIPRMQIFQEENPDLELRISTVERITDVNHENIDLAIYYGNENWPHLHKDLLFEDYLMPVTSPFVSHKKALKFIYVTADLRKNDWSLWSKAANLAEPKKTERIYFPSSALALQAAQAGVGIAIAHKPFVIDYLNNGQLVTLSNVKVKLPDNYYLICQQHQLTQHKIRKFRAWLLKEIKKDFK